jgi:hypothetical protein
MNECPECTPNHAENIDAVNILAQMKLKKKQDFKEYYELVKEKKIHCPICDISVKRFSWNNHRASKQHLLKQYSSQFGEIEKIKIKCSKFDK